MRRIKRLDLATAILAAFACAGQAWGFEKVSIRVPGFAKPIQVYVVTPPGVQAPERLPTILALPPGPGSAKMVEGALAKYWEKEAVKRKMVVLCPQMQGQAFARAAFRLVPSVLGYAARRYPVDTRKVVVAGNSNGGVGAFGCFVQCPARFAGMVVFPGAPLSGVDVPRTLSGKAAYVLVGEKDETWIRGSEEMNEYLRRAGVQVRYEVVPGQGHSLDIAPKKLFDWIESVLSR
ncbi:MAG: hypothetical protein GXP31_06195 [Kiritimatiellaeota bacterium]|nr:hypothetical protein [Kiritimatiellota bacterium]